MNGTAQSVQSVQSEQSVQSVQSEGHPKIHPEDYIPLARSIAAKVAARTPKSVDLDDLAGEAILAICEAAQRYDSTRASFATYAYLRANYACIDYLRRNGFFEESRGTRRKVRQLNAACNKLEQETGRKPALDDVAAMAGIEPEQAEQVMATAESLCVRSSDAPIQIFDRKGSIGDMEGGNGTTTRLSRVRDPDALAILEAQETRDTIVKSLRVLDMQQLAVFALHNMGDYTFGDIGSILGLTDSRICQIHTKLRKKLLCAIRRITMEGDTTWDRE